VKFTREELRRLDELVDRYQQLAGEATGRVSRSSVIHHLIRTAWKSSSSAEMEPGETLRTETRTTNFDVEDAGRRLREVRRGWTKDAIVVRNGEPVPAVEPKRRSKKQS